MPDARQYFPQVVIAHHDALVLRLRRGIDKDPRPLGLPALDIPSQAEHIGANIAGRLLERNEDPALLILHNAFGEKLYGENGLGAARGARHECGAGLGEPAIGDKVETRHPSRQFVDCGSLTHDVASPCGRSAKLPAVDGP